MGGAIYGMIIVLLSHRTDRAASAEPSLLELCRDALEEDESQSTENTEIIYSNTDRTDLTDLWGPAKWRKTQKFESQSDWRKEKAHTDLTDKDRSKGLGQRSKGYGVIHYSRLAL